MAYAGARVPKVAKHRVCVTAPPRSTTSLHKNRPVRATLDIWPVLPLEIEYHRMDTWEVQDDVIAALEHHDRVRKISLGPVPNPVWETLAAAMQVPFPELTSLWLWSEDRSVPVLPDSFLGGSAPRLQTLSLEGFHFRECGTYFCLPVTSSILNFGVFPIRDTFHPSRWSPACPR
jgi:hypothetical protein